MNLTNEQIKNLIVFLNRTQLQGKETEILVQLKVILMQELEKLEEVLKPIEDKKVEE